MKALKLFIFFATFLVFFPGAAFPAGPSVSNSYTFDGPTESYKIQDSFSASGSGLNSVLNNPAGIARSSTFEVSLGYGETLSSKTVATFTTTDKDLGSIGGDNSFFKAGLFFTDDPLDAPTNEFKTRDIKATLNYDHGGGLTDFGAAFNFGGVFAFGITRQRPSSLDMGLVGYAPTIFRGTVNMLGQTIEGLSILPDGTASFTGAGTTFATALPLWPGFTNNTSDAAISSTVNFVNKATDSREITLTFGGSFGNLMWGVNAIPISSDIVLNNYVVSQVSSTGADMVYYVPNFDPNDPASIEWWANETDQRYATVEGYAPYVLMLSREAPVYNGMASGNYSASAIRVDLGFIWQATKDISMSFGYENIGGANLVYKGTGVTSTVESYVNRNSTPSFELGGGGSWDPLMDTPEAVEGVNDFTLPDEFTVTLPRKGKVGIAVTSPLFFAIDYERYFSDIIYDSATVRDLSFLKIGFESQLFALPLVLRAESTWLLKPTILGLTDPEEVKNVNDFLDKYPALPTESKWGLGFKFGGMELGGDFMENHASLLSIYEGGMLDFMKVLSYDVYLRADSWDITYTVVAEPFYILAQNAELFNENNNGEAVSANQVKTNFIYSLKLGLKF